MAYIVNVHAQRGRWETVHSAFASDSRTLEIVVDQAKKRLDIYTYQVSVALLDDAGNTLVHVYALRQGDRVGVFVSYGDEGRYKLEDLNNLEQFLDRALGYVRGAEVVLSE